MKKQLSPPPPPPSVSSTDHHFRNYKDLHKKRLSVREIVSKFEKKMTAPANLSDEIEILLESLEKHMLVQELRDSMESLRERVSGQNKNYVHKAIAMIEALAVHQSIEEEEAERIKDFLEKLKMRRMGTSLFEAEEIGNSNKEKINVLDEWVWVES